MALARLPRLLRSSLPLALALAAGLSLGPGGDAGRTAPALPAPPAGSPNLPPPPASGIEPISALRQTYDSALLGQQRRYEVALPPGYSENPQRRYPVIVLLHGGSGDQGDWFNPGKGDALATLQQLYRSGELPPSLVVAPDGNDRRGRSRTWDPEYFDGPNGPMATALGDELVKVIQSRYRTLPTPGHWALGGLSSGAWGALNIGLKWPNHFAILFSHSGYMVDRSGPANSPQHTLPRLSPAQLRTLRIYLDTGSADAHYREESTRFQALLEQLGVRSEFRVFPGSHSWAYWRQHLADSLRFVGAQWSQPG